jgi:phospholipid/cholesterol/gamma-HCH transport system substrate-binding protein
VQSQAGGAGGGCGTAGAAAASGSAGGSIGNSLPVALNDGGTSGGLAGSSAELDFVRGLLGYQTGVDPSKVSDLAAAQLAPVLRGTQVVIP